MSYTISDVPYTKCHYEIIRCLLKNEIYLHWIEENYKRNDKNKNIVWIFHYTFPFSQKCIDINIIKGKLYSWWMFLERQLFKLVYKCKLTLNEMFSISNVKCLQF